MSLLITDVESIDIPYSHTAEGQYGSQSLRLGKDSIKVSVKQSDECLYIYIESSIFLILSPRTLTVVT